MEAGIKKGRPLPEWVLEAPDLAEGDDFFLKAFWDLSTGRQVGMATGPIPWRDILQYASYSGLERDVADAFVVIIRSMDAGFMEWQAKEAERTANRGK